MVTSISFILLAVGLALVAAEIHLITRHNAIGMLGVLSVLVGIIIAFANRPIAGLVCTATAILAGFGLFIYLRLSGALKRYEMARAGTSPELIEAKEIRSRYLGREGIALTPMRPSGTIRVMGDELPAATEGEFIAQGSTVRVVAMDSQKYFVKLDDAK